MKKIVFALAVLLGSVNFASAQDDGLDNGVFLGVGTGMNFGFDGLKYDDRSTSHNGAGFATDFYFGGWFGKIVGARAGYQGFTISDRYTDFGNRKYNYVHGDVLFRPHRNIIPYVHGGYVHIVNPGFGGGAGLMFPIHLGRFISIVPDLKATAYSSNVFGIKEHNVALTLSATVGLAVRFGTRKKSTQPAAIPPEEPAPRVIRDIVVMAPVVKVVHDTVLVKEVVTNVVRDTVFIEQHDTTILHPEKIKALALFDTDKSFLRTEVYPDLDRIVAWFRKYPDAHAVIEGHTDNSASAKYNQAHSERRAQAVYIYLVSHGVAADRLTWVGYGLTRPVDTNSTPEGRQRNRRVEIHVE